MVQVYDYVIIGVYLVFMLSLGILFQRDEQEYLGLFPVRQRHALVDHRHLCLGGLLFRAGHSSARRRQFICPA